MRDEILKNLGNSITKESKIDYIAGNTNNKNIKKVERFNKYLDYSVDFLEDNLKNDKDKRHLKEMIKLLTDQDKALLVHKGLLEDGMEEMESSDYGADNRSTYDYWLSIQIGSVMEKMAILEGKFNGYKIYENEEATHSNSDNVCYEPDFILETNGLRLELELQTVDKKHEHIVCKSGKLKALKRYAQDESRNVYILQQTIVDGECTYAVVNVRNSFVPLEFGIERGTMKKWLRAEEKAVYKSFDETIKGIKREIEAKIDKDKKPLTLDELAKIFKNKATITNKTKKRLDLGVEH